jgi:hypothetical protein
MDETRGNSKTRDDGLVSLDPFPAIQTDGARRSERTRIHLHDRSPFLCANEVHGLRLLCSNQASVFAD